MTWVCLWNFLCISNNHKTVGGRSRRNLSCSCRWHFHNSSLKCQIIDHFSLKKGFIGVVCCLYIDFGKAWTHKEFSETFVCKEIIELIAHLRMDHASNHAKIKVDNIIIGTYNGKIWFCYCKIAQENLSCSPQKPILLTWINCNPNMYKMWNMGWNYVFILQLLRFYDQSLGIDKWLNPVRISGYDYLSMLGS